MFDWFAGWLSLYLPSLWGPNRLEAVSQSNWFNCFVVFAPNTHDYHWCHSSHTFTRRCHSPSDSCFLNLTLHLTSASASSSPFHLMFFPIFPHLYSLSCLISLLSHISTLVSTFLSWSHFIFSDLFPFNQAFFFPLRQRLSDVRLVVYDMNTS